MNLRLNDPDPRIRDLAYLLFLAELLGPEWVERWARERGKLDALREWRATRSASSVAKDREKAPACSPGSAAGGRALRPDPGSGRAYLDRIERDPRIFCPRARV